MIKFRKLKLKKLLRSPLAIILLLVLVWPLLWIAASTLTVATHYAGLSGHLGATRGYFNSNKLTDFATLPFDRIDLSYGYGTRYFWVSEGTEIYLKYSVVNHGEDPVNFVISDYNTGLKAGKEFASAKVEETGSGVLRYRAKRTGFYKVLIIPKRLVSATEDVRYSYSMSWGTGAKTMSSADARQTGGTTGS